jgi:hypothetical protein
MTIVIDTGAEPRALTAADFVPDWAYDQAPDANDPAGVVRFYVYTGVIGHGIQRPKKDETALKHMLAEWNFLRQLGEESPFLLNEILTAYVEKLQGGE